jgi:hypothetical protein
MMYGAAVGAIVYILLASCILALLVALLVAPLKLYGIHREIRNTNEPLKAPERTVAVAGRTTDTINYGTRPHSGRMSSGTMTDTGVPSWKLQSSCG